MRFLYTHFIYIKLPCQDCMKLFMLSIPMAHTCCYSYIPMGAKISWGLGSVVDDLKQKSTRFDLKQALPLTLCLSFSFYSALVISVYSFFTRHTWHKGGKMCCVLFLIWNQLCKPHSMKTNYFLFDLALISIVATDWWSLGKPLNSFCFLEMEKCWNIYKNIV